jgi:hypothetical protein
MSLIARALANGNVGIGRRSYLTFASQLSSTSGPSNERRPNSFAQQQQRIGGLWGSSSSTVPLAHNFRAYSSSMGSAPPPPRKGRGEEGDSIFSVPARGYTEYDEKEDLALVERITAELMERSKYEQGTDGAAMLEQWRTKEVEKLDAMNSYLIKRRK